MAKKSTSTKKKAIRPTPLTPKAGFKPGTRYGDGGSVKK